MRDQADRVRLLARQDADDVGDARRAPELVAPRIGFLDAHVEPDLPQLIDDVFPWPCALAGVPTGRLPIVPASMLTWATRVGVVEEGGLPGAGRREQRGREEQAEPRRTWDDSIPEVASAPDSGLGTPSGAARTQG